MSSYLRIVDYNYTFKDNVEITASSQNADFPATNVGHEFRAKTWRSAGTFVIDATNNKINFKETGGGAELTATVAVGTYSVSTLATAIKTAMETASVNSRVYTISQSASTGKWTISTTVFLSLLFSTGTNAATSIRNAIGFGSTDFTGSISYTGPDTAIHTEEGVVIDLQTAEEIDTIALVFDPRLGIKLSDSAVITVQASSSNAWVTPLFSQSISIDNTWSIATLFLTTPEEYRFWRIKVVDPENAYLYIELGTIVLGKARDVGRCPDNGFELKIIDQSKKEKNAYGNEFVDTYPNKKSMSFNFNILDYTVKKSIEESFKLVGSHEPIFVWLDPTETLFDKDDFAIYGKYDKDVSFKHIVRNYFSSGLSIEEVF